MAIQNPRRGEAATSAAGTIVVEIPARLMHLVAPVENLIESVGKRVDQLGRNGRAADYAAIERGTRSRAPRSRPRRTNARWWPRR
jgi:hypothetical protein